MTRSLRGEGDTTMTTLAGDLASYLAAFDLRDAPAEVVEKARACIRDTVGVALAGARSPWARSAIAAALSEGPDGGPAHVVGTARSTSASLAALANGTSGHSLDFDDDNAQVHAGAAVVAVGLAVGEVVNASGQEFVRSVIVGYETAVRVAWAMDPDALYARGFHPTGVCNAFGSAMTAGVLLGLDEKRLVDAIGIVGSMAGGLLEFYTDGAMTKRLHGGHPASCGVMAAKLASHGFTGPATVFEGPFGALRAYAGEATRPDEITRGLGTDFKILATAQKYYPMNFATHGAIDAVRRIMEREGLAPEQIARVAVHVRPFVAEAIGGSSKHRPATILAAQMSMPFAVALAATEGRITLDHLSERWVRDETILQIAAKVTTFACPELDHVAGIEDGSVLPTRLTIETDAGQEFSDEIIYQRGDPNNPLSDQDLGEKFLDCASRTLGSERALEVSSDLDRVVGWNDITNFMHSLEVRADEHTTVG
ncbi:MAG: hypothetical protein GEU90_21580 [Gemmatimonas sp.]|nr:hypothetical protein [Gemmatimonas sp.]